MQEVGKFYTRDDRAAAWRIFLAFLRLGCTAFGGPAMVAYIRELGVRKRGWLSEESFADGVALCQSIPGATAMQTAGYVGFRARGPLGALAAFVGFALPAFVLMVGLSVVYERTHELGPVVSALRGLQVVVVALVANAAVSFGRASLRGWRDGALAAGLAAFLIAWKVLEAAGVEAPVVPRGSPAAAIGLAALIGVLLYGRDNSSVRGPRAVSLAVERAAAAEDFPSRWRRLPAYLIGGVLAMLAALWVLSPKLFGLSTLMMKVDLLAFGGGYASVPLMQHEVVDERHWMTSGVFMHGIALGQTTPGPIVITATFVGYQIAGILGAIVGTVSIFAPSFIVLVGVMPYFARLRQSALFRHALRGVLVSFVGLLLAVTVKFGLEVAWTGPAVALAVGALVALLRKVDILWVVLAGAVVSVVVL